MFVTLSCTFRYGRDDMDVMGIAFRRELYLSTRQVYPPLQDTDKAVHTKIQAKLLRKLGEHAYPFFFEVSCDWSARGKGSQVLWWLWNLGEDRFLIKGTILFSPVS